MRIELVVTDLDGTLWDTEVRCGDRTRDALAELSRRDVPVLVATGRRARSAGLGFEANGIDLPVVLLNGTLGMESVRGSSFHRAGFSREDAVRVVEAFLAHGQAPCAYLAGSTPDVVLHDRPTTAPAHLEALAAHALQGHLPELVSAHDVLAFSTLGQAHDELEPVHADLVAAGFTDVYLTPDHLYGGWSLMVQPNGVHKWVGVEAFCRHVGVDPANVLAVGDGRNDVELLTGARIGVAMADGHPDAVAAADVVVAGPHAWADLLDHVL